MTLKTKPKDCAQHMQKARDRVKENRAKEKTKKLAKKNQELKETVKKDTK